MSNLQPARGTHDILPDEMRAQRRVVDIAGAVAERYGYEFMATPIFEFSQVFKRTLGDTSDIVTKEMYTFTDKGDDEITLRPENTAGVARCYMSQGLAQKAPVRFFYAGPMFRYERPQKGRLRQFHQFGIENIGIPGAFADIEVIATGARILDELGVADKTVLELNTLGDGESRDAYRTVLVEYLENRIDELSKESRDRLNRNPLRILDSKDEGDRKVVAEAPVFSDYLNNTSRAFFDEVREGLAALDISYRLNPRLVRGLDYYSHTAFEFTTEYLGSQGTVMAGGRYDGLIGMMGGPATPGVGWAAGIERLAMLCGEAPAARRPIAVVPVGEEARMPALKLSEELRRAGYRVDLGHSGNLSKRMKRANKVNAAAALIIGEDELARGAATLRDLDSGEQEEAPLASLVDRLARFR
ncbi:MAG: histidine--tRNA ligase [Alphaproteobacteria bacterium]|nr:histidine--tRNA ligase [Alphaproteobacteria bacterium]